MLQQTVVGLGYELVDIELSSRGKLLRVFIDKPPAAGAGGVTVDDCARVSNQLSRVLEVEGVDYDRLEISSPGLDRPLKTEADFARFVGEQVRLKLRVPLGTRRNFVGVMRAVTEGRLQLEVEQEVVSLELANIDKARLVPRIEF